MTLRHTRVLAAFIFAALFTAPARADDKDKPKPEVKGASLLALRAGQTATVFVYGDNLAPTAITAKPPLVVKMGEIKDTDAETAKARGGAKKQVAVEVSAPADCPPDVYDLILVHEGDQKPTARIAIVAPAGTELEVKRPNATFAQAMPLPAEAASVAVTGALPGDTADLFRFEAHAGETWEIIVLAGRAGSPLDPIVRVRDARRIPLALAAGDEKKDRRLTFRAPTDGVYFLELTDAENRGGPTYVYRLTLARKNDTKAAQATPPVK